MDDKYCDYCDRPESECGKLLTMSITGVEVKICDDCYRKTTEEAAQRKQFAVESALNRVQGKPRRKNRDIK